MPSTYTQNLGIEKPATGEQAGVWGVTANNSYDFLDTAIAGVAAIQLSASSYTLATNPGVASIGRNKMFIWTGALTQSVTINITPNTGQHLYMMQNETTGGYPLLIQQGSGTVFTLQSGYDAWVYADGNGTAASVAAALSDPQFGNVLITGSLALGSAGLPAVFSLADSSPTSPSLTYRAPASMLIDMGGAELAVSASLSIWLQARTSSSAAWVLTLNPLGGNVGIGTRTPQATLDVTGSVHTSGNLAVSGNLGIGVTSPAEPLVIANAPGYGQLRMAYGNYGAFFLNNGSAFYVMATASGNAYGTYTSPYPLMVTFGSNAVSIWGGPTAGFALTVNGSINLTGGYYVNGQPLATAPTNFAQGGALNQVYQNTTGRFMYVTVGVYLGGPGNAIAYCDTGYPPSTVVAHFSTPAGWFGDHVSFTFFVMPNWFYRVYTDSGNLTLDSWTEWY